MIWYYQVGPHDISNYDPGWKVMLAEVEEEGRMKKVVIGGVRSNFVYVLDAETGEPIYDPVHLGPPNFNTLNENAGNMADMRASQRRYIGSIFCPSHLGGIFAAPAFAYNTIFVPSQNVCGTVVEERIEYKGMIIDGFRYELVLDPPTNGTIYAVDASSGRVKWETPIPNRIQSAALVVSGGLLYTIDSAGVFYVLDVETGSILKQIPFNAIGAAGVAIGGDATGGMMVVFAVGGSEFFDRGPGILIAMGLPSSENISPFIDYRDLVIVVSLGTVVILVAYIVTIRNRVSKGS